MLSEDVMQDLLRSALDGLEQMAFVGVNEANFHATSPELPFGDEEVGAAAAFCRSQGTPALGIRLQCAGVVDHILVVGRTEADLDQGRAKMENELGKLPGVTLTILGRN